MAQPAQGQAHGFPLIIKQRHLALEAGPVSPQKFPIRWRAIDPLPVVNQARCAPSSRDAVAIFGVIAGILVGFQQILQPQQSIVIQLPQQIALSHLPHHVIGGIDDAVLTAAARLQLGQHHLIGIKNIHHHRQARFLLEPSDQ